MSSRLYELKARIKADASVALEVRDLYTVNGKEIEGDPRPLTADDADTVAFLAGFNSAAVAERDAKIAELAQAQADHQAALAAKEAEHAAALSTLNTEHAEALQAKADEIAALTESLAAATAAKQTAEATAETALTAAQARIEELEAELDALKNPPVVPSILDPADFLERFTDAELDTIQTANNPVARKAERALFTRKSVDLTSPLLAELMAALVAVELLTAERAAAIMEIGE